MPDIQLRFNKDMLVLSAPYAPAMKKQGIDVDKDMEFINLIEPDTVRDCMRMELAAGAQCLLTSTEGITTARLAHHGMEDRSKELAMAAMAVSSAMKPQHLIVEIGPCGLPLDPSSKASLIEHREQYSEVIRIFESYETDAYFLSGFSHLDELKAAIAGVRKVSDRPLFASVNVNEASQLPRGRADLADALISMQSFGVNVAGIRVSAPLQSAVALAHEAWSVCDLPLLVELVVGQNNPKQGIATPENPYYCPDVMVEAAVRLRAEGVQFLRAVGNASPAYTGAMVVATAGFDVVNP